MCEALQPLRVTEACALCEVVQYQKSWDVWLILYTVI